MIVKILARVAARHEQGEEGGRISLEWAHNLEQPDIRYAGLTLDVNTDELLEKFPTVRAGDIVAIEVRKATVKEIKDATPKAKDAEE